MAEAKSDADKLTVAIVKARLKEIKGNSEAADERNKLTEWSALAFVIAEVAHAKKDKQSALNAKVATQYAKLSWATQRT